MVSASYLCKAPILGDGRVAVVQRAGHAAHRHAAGAVRRDARRLRSGRAPRARAAALAARPEPATSAHTMLFMPSHHTINPVVNNVIITYNTVWLNMDIPFCILTDHLIYLFYIYTSKHTNVALDFQMSTMTSNHFVTGAKIIRLLTN